MESLNPAGWSSIRPWIPPLSLSVREITSVSVTFVLSAASSDLNSETELSLAVLGISTEDLHEDEDGADDEDASAFETEAKKSISIVSSALAGGLSVEVDRSPWRRVFIKIDDKADEAVIIVYGLMPGRQYEIILELVQGGQTNSIRQQVTTEENESKDTSHPPDADSLAPPTSNGDSNNTSGSTRPSTPPHSGGTGPQPSTSPGFGFAPLTLEDHLTQLQHTLSLLNSEQVSLNSTIKSSRRDAQKADATLRAEIDVLKRASERYLASEQRSKQKVLALQEAVKRTQIGTKEMEASVIEVNNELPGLREAKQKREAEHKRVKEEAMKVQRDKEAEAEQERKRVESMKIELNSLGKQMEKLEMKKEKLEGVVIKELEEQLESIEKEIEMLAREEEAILNGYPQSPMSQTVSPNWVSASVEGRYDEDEIITPPFTHGIIGRPSPSSISNSTSLQRPRGPVHPNSLPHVNPQWIPGTPVTSPRQSQRSQHPPNHINQRSSSFPQPNQHGNSHHPYPHQHHHSHTHHPTRPHQPSPTTILTNPNRQNLKNAATGSGGGSISVTASHAADPS
jgi:hypothetical protein